MACRKIDAVIFDFGNVLTFPNDHSGILSLIREIPLEEGLFLSIYRKNRPPFDRGTISIEEYWDNVFKELSVKNPEKIIPQFIQKDTDDWTRINESVLKWQSVLREQGYTTAVLSNLPEYYGMHFRQNFPWLKKFHEIIFSCDVDSIKPEPEIYKVCIDRLGIEPSRGLFLDDMKENVIAAREAGLHAEVFEYTENCTEFIKSKYSLPLFYY